MSTLEMKTIYCCECKGFVQARLTNGFEVYPHRNDLYRYPFWICDTCNNFVGCHHRTANRTKPLGCIPNEEIRNARRHLHALIDPVWKSGLVTRNFFYKHISKLIGKEFHVAEIRSIEEARQVCRIAQQYINQLNK